MRELSPGDGPGVEVFQAYPAIRDDGVFGPYTSVGTFQVRPGVSFVVEMDVLVPDPYLATLDPRLLVRGENDYDTGEFTSAFLSCFDLFFGAGILLAVTTLFVWGRSSARAA